MDNPPTNPIYVTFFFILRCIVPLMIMLGLSYLLKKLGLISETPKPPADESEPNHSSDDDNGGYAHA